MEEVGIPDSTLLCNIPNPDQKKSIRSRQNLREKRLKKALIGISAGVR